LAAAKIAADRGSPALEQLALADLITHGELDRHLHRMRPVYRRRRDALVTALAQRLPQLEPAGVAPGPLGIYNAARAITLVQDRGKRPTAAQDVHAEQTGGR
jgi:hypothetical protein